MSRRKMTLADYPQEFFTIWELACQGRLKLEFEEKGTATNFRHRLMAFRKQVRENGDPAMGLRFSEVDILQPVYNQHTGVYELRDGLPAWKAQVRQATAGIQQTVTPPLDKLVPPLDTPAPIASSEPDALNTALKNMGFSED